MIKIEKRNNGKFQFVLKNASGSALFQSTYFSSQEAVSDSLTQLSLNQPTYARFERQTDHSGNFLFQLRSLQGARIGKSATYSSEAGMENGIKNFKRYLEHWQQNLS